MKNKITIIFFIIAIVIVITTVYRPELLGGKMFFSKFEDVVLKEYKENLKSDKSINNIIKVFTENYSTVNNKYNRDEDADMLLFQYGVYDWGDGKNLEIDFVRQLLKNDNIVQVHITIKIPYTDKFSNINFQILILMTNGITLQLRTSQLIHGVIKFKICQFLKQLIL